MVNHSPFLKSVTVSRAAELLCCNQATVRSLLRCGGLDGHRVGKNDENPRGVRVYLQSVLDYKARHSISAVNPQTAEQRRHRRQRTSISAHEEAIAALRAAGYRV